MRTAIAFGAGMVGLALSMPAMADDTASSGQSQVAVPAAGMRVHIDPDTGERRSAPSGTEQPAAMFTGSVPTADLVEEVNPAGGFTVDLQRRFGGVARASVGSDGKVAVDCETDAKPEGDR